MYRTSLSLCEVSYSGNTDVLSCTVVRTCIFGQKGFCWPVRDQSHLTRKLFEIDYRTGEC